LIHVVKEILEDSRTKYAPNSREMQKELTKRRFTL